MNRTRTLRQILLWVLIPTVGFSSELKWGAQQQRFLDQHCMDCHDSAMEEGGLDLETLSTDLGDIHTLRRWVKVMDRIHHDEMPPTKRERPNPKEKADFIHALKTQLTNADRMRQETEGRTVARRLNRVEYENTLRDLLDLPVLELKEMLPPDDSAHGFNNVAEAQSFSYVQISRYLDAAEVAIDMATHMGERPEKQLEHRRFREESRFRGREGKGRGETRYVGDDWLVFLRQPNSAQTPWRINNKQVDRSGQYRIRIRCQGVVYEGQHDEGRILPQDRQHVVTIYTRNKRILHKFDVPADPEVIEFTAWLHGGDQLEFFCASLDDRNSAGAGKFPDKPYRGPGIAADFIEIEGPIDQEFPRESHRRLFGSLTSARWTPDSGLREPYPLNLPDLTGNQMARGQGRNDKGNDLWMVVSEAPLRDAERLLRSFMKRAYRHPVSEDEFQRCFAFARKEIEDKACFQDAMRPAFKAALCSPDFLFFKESPGHLDGHALAARLSYFLWRTLPDEELLKHAESGELLQDKVLRAQTERLLNDPRCRRFAADFTSQWLDTGEVHETAPDRYLYPEYFCDVHLVESAVEETTSFFMEMLDQNLGALTTIDSDFLTINGRLAEVYDIPGVTGEAIRRVSIPADSQRGGFLTQSSILKVTANGLTTSPVIRGAWVKERLLGIETPPPPPNAGAIEPDTRGATTIRELLDEHRRNESCASCHRSIDPPGFALESFDVMGAFRDYYRSFEKGEEVKIRIADRGVRFRKGPPVDATGTITGGGDFRDINEFRSILRQQERTIAENLTKRLMTFATGAGISIHDRKTVHQILNQTDRTGHGLRDLVHAVIQSETFRQK